MTTQSVITTVVFAGYNCIKKTENGKSMPFAFLEFGDEDREILVHGEILSDLKAGSTVKAELSDIKKLAGRHPTMKARSGIVQSIEIVSLPHGQSRNDLPRIRKGPRCDA